MGDTVTYAAPGRINLIGEHTDYNLGLALPIALPQRVVVRYQPDDSEAITVSSAQESGDVVVPLDTTPGDITGWAAYIAGVVWALRDGRRVSGSRRHWASSRCARCRTVAWTRSMR